MATRRSIGRILFDAREELKLSQTALARASNHTPGFISRLESAGDIESVKFATIASIAVPLGLSLDEIAFLTGLTKTSPGMAGSAHGPALALIGEEIRGLRGALEGALRKLDAAEREIESLSRQPVSKEKKRAPLLRRAPKS